MMITYIYTSTTTAKYEALAWEKKPIPWLWSPPLVCLVLAIYMSTNTAKYEALTWERKPIPRLQSPALVHLVLAFRINLQCSVLFPTELLPSTPRWISKRKNHRYQRCIKHKCSIMIINLRKYNICWITMVARDIITNNGLWWTAGIPGSWWVYIVECIN